jgi:hypothetical protein
MSTFTGTVQPVCGFVTHQNRVPPKLSSGAADTAVVLPKDRQTGTPPVGVCVGLRVYVFACMHV